MVACMNQFPFTKLTLAVLISFQLGGCLETEEELIERAQGIHGRVITLDTHCLLYTSDAADAS